MKRCITEDLTDSNPYSDSGNEDAKIYCASKKFFFSVSKTQRMNNHITNLKWYKRSREIH